MITTFPRLPDGTLQAVNTSGQWLACDDANSTKNAKADLLVLAGNAVIPTIDAACERAATQEIPLLITGGVGHSTTFLYAAIARHPRYNTIQTTGRSEAAILADIAREFWNLPHERIITEEQSTNCGENAAFSRRLLDEWGMAPKRIILSQDPTMQRRTVATFARAWRDADLQPEWVSQPGVVPVLRNGSRSVQFVEGDSGMWPPERFISLILGEIPRLRDDHSGYGPRGRDFITHVDIPPEVEQAWQALFNDPILTQALRNRSLL
ncbi:YdcF family protein [Siccibacter colletis]|uniref:YdcF family protein n=1 Tax=Siccibacter colletis TaxID=1505757 RepID=UPI003CFB15E6